MSSRLSALVTVWVLGTAAAVPNAYTAQVGTATFEHRVLFVNVKGNIPGVTATVTLDPTNLSVAQGTVTVPVVNLNTGISLRDNDARSERALDTAHHPNATFALYGIPGGHLIEGETLVTTVVGKLTVKGTTLSINAPVKATLVGGQITVNTQFKFNPHDYGVNYPNSSNVVTVNVTFTLVPPR
ncbi:YceI family protein [Deinococcus sp.]|uniref:YceI family protein n=1 Tax=Deinococcus sp. TaxID=47478 RepID=UPI002869AC53|nr:YceI family protein [Deinococcus sp.]